MAQRDSAFLWETEALRSARPVPPPPKARPSGDERWVTLRQASEMTGIPVSTIRKWALRQTVTSHLEQTPTGDIRMVSIAAVYERARSLGRTVKTVAPAGDERAAPSPPTTRLQQAEPDIPEGTMLVPLDAWTKVLNQLGNLHEAGQQLADARERAAKAETEAAFLRERLAELRDQLSGVERPGVASATGSDAPQPEAPARQSPWSAGNGVWTAIRRPRKRRA